MEFAVVLVLLIILVFGITEIGRALYQENMLTKAVNIGARYVARQHDLLNDAMAPTMPCEPKSSTRWAQVEAAAKRLVLCGQPDSCAASEPVIPGLSSGTITIPTPAPGAIGSGGRSACVITIRATASFIPLFGDVIVPFANLGGFQLSARTEERYIGE